MIEVRGLERRFGDVVAVDGVSFTARDGRITGLLGPNGAGKTTTLRTLYGLLRPDAGTVAIDGIDAVADPIAVQRLIGVLPDAHGLYVRLTAREHLRYVGELHALDAATIERSIDRLVALLDMGDIIDRRVAGFSTGERMKSVTRLLLLRAAGPSPTARRPSCASGPVRTISRRRSCGSSAPTRDCSESTRPRFRRPGARGLAKGSAPTPCATGAR